MCTKLSFVASQRNRFHAKHEWNFKNLIKTLNFVLFTVPTHFVLEVISGAVTEDLSAVVSVCVSEE